MKWIAFFSMTGSEIINVAQQLGKFPDAVVTNKTSLENVDLRLLDPTLFDNIFLIPNKPSLQDYQTVLDNLHVTKSNALITLHGFLRIVPPEICNDFFIVNGHPGLITTYPDLKGKDPQARAIHHAVIGSVLHKVTASVDEGPVIDAASCDNIYHTVEGVTQQLKQLSQALWVKYLSKHL